jgi:allantoinase
MAPALDLIVKNVRVVRPQRTPEGDVERRDLGIRDGRFVRIAHEIPPSDGAEVYDGRGLLAFPGLVDAHTHVGIYSPVADDAVTESKAAAAGGVTTMLTYFRSGEYYLNRGGPYAELYPELLRRSEGRYWVDYGYHVAPIQGRHLDEMEALATDHGVPSFKIFMFYGGYGLHGQTHLEAQRRFLRLEEDDSYDLAHFEFVMRAAARLRERHPALAPHVSVSLHCEVADLLNAYTRLVQRDATLTGLRAYSAARPPHSEALGVWIAAALAHETGCVNVNLLHLSSRKAVEAALEAARAFPDVDFRREVTVGHLLLDYDTGAGALAKVNPPIRSREDVEHLWRAVLDRQIDWVVSDHACCATETKVAAERPVPPGPRPDDVWPARAGFGGTEYLLSGVFGEGTRRGLSYARVAELTAWNPARRFGLGTKGDVAVGYDADLALLDPARTFTVRAAESESAQGYTPFEGLELTGRVRATFVRGQLVYEDGKIVGPARGRYVSRPTAPPTGPFTGG